MAGHSKWANIKHRKGKADAQRGKIFTKIGREIAVAVKAGGVDPSTNSRLFDVIAKAKSNNMPNDTITRSIKKASGELGAINYETIVYEGYGIGGSAVIVETLTDNKNRTAGEVRCAFDKYGGSMGTTNCVNFMFDRKGVVVCEKQQGQDEDSLFELVLTCGGDDLTVFDDIFEVVTLSSSLREVTQALENSVKVLSSESVLIPQNTVKLNEEQLLRFGKMIEVFEDNDDVQNVFHNVELPEEN